VTVAILFARRDSVYKTLPDCDVWDEDRDARRWPGGCPVVAHPPCRGWGQLRHLSNPVPGERELALTAVEFVRLHGGVLEHPKLSTLWSTAGLPHPGRCDDFGGWTMPVFQSWFGHRADKPTLLYIVGTRDLPPLPLALGDAPRICGSSGRRRDGTRLHSGDPGFRSEITKAEREHTPIEFARWLVEVAKRCKS